MVIRDWWSVALGLRGRRNLSVHLFPFDPLEETFGEALAAFSSGSYCGAWRLRQKYV